MSVIGIIPARGGSKRVFGKNIRLLGAKPLIAYTIEVAKKTFCIDRVVVSTDDEAIAAVARDYGADVPFMRPAHLAQDDTADAPVLRHAVEALQMGFQETDLLVFLRPTTPFKTPEMVTRAVDLLRANTALTSLRTVSVVEGDFHPYWMFSEKEGVLEPFVRGINLKKYYQRQLLPPCYRLNGLVDVLRVQQVLRQEEGIYGERIGLLKIKERFAVDIDSEFDFEIAELLMKKGLVNELPFV